MRSVAVYMALEAPAHDRGAQQGRGWQAREHAGQVVEGQLGEGLKQWCSSRSFSFSTPSGLGLKNAKMVDCSLTGVPSLSIAESLWLVKTSYPALLKVATGPHLI